MKLSALILDELEAILSDWEQFARTILPVTQSMDAGRVRYHAGEILIGGQRGR